MRVTGASTVIGTFSSLQRRQSGAISGPRIQFPVASLLRKRAQLVRRRRIHRIHATHTVKYAGKALENAGKVAIVPLVMNHLDDDCAGYAIGAHQLEQRLHRRIFGRELCTRRKWKLRITLEDVHMRVDHPRLTRRGSHCPLNGPAQWRR
jgi:hypothetical protein